MNLSFTVDIYLKAFFSSRVCNGHKSLLFKGHLLHCSCMQAFFKNIKDVIIFSNFNFFIM